MRYQGSTTIAQTNEQIATRIADAIARATNLGFGHSRSVQSVTYALSRVKARDVRRFAREVLSITFPADVTANCIDIRIAGAVLTAATA